jgi:hypothetical protein
MLVRFRVAARVEFVGTGETEVSVAASPKSGDLADQRQHVQDTTTYGDSPQPSRIKTR